LAVNEIRVILLPDAFGSFAMNPFFSKRLKIPEIVMVFKFKKAFSLAAFVLKSSCSDKL